MWPRRTIWMSSGWRNGAVSSPSPRVSRVSLKAWFVSKAALPRSGARASRLAAMSDGRGAWGLRRASGGRSGVAVGEVFSIADLFGQGYEAVFLGVGAALSTKLDIEGNTLEGVFHYLTAGKSFIFALEIPFGILNFFTHLSAILTT